MGPVNLLLPTINRLSEVNKPMDEGMLPDRLFSNSTRLSRLTRKPMDEGIVPESPTLYSSSLITLPSPLQVTLEGGLLQEGGDSQVPPSDALPLRDE